MFAGAGRKKRKNTWNRWRQNRSAGGISKEARVAEAKEVRGQH